MTDPTDAAVREPAAASPRWKTTLKVVVGLAMLGALLWLGREAGDYVPAFREWVEGLGFWGPLVFVLAYAVATVAFLPGSLLTLAAGAVFGIAEGTLWAFLGALLGSSASFLIARYAARGWVEKKIEGRPRFQAVDRAVGREGAKVVALLRLSPVFPFNLLNYALGLTGVKFRHYLVASLAMLPGTLLYVYYGKVGGDLVTAAGGAGEKTIWDWVLLGVGLAATVVVTVLIARKAKAALEEEVGIDGEPEPEPAAASEGGSDG
jgi:uncharacterized membrane protein YdjX (TVP38/TMEM64 family)